MKNKIFKIIDGFTQLMFVLATVIILWLVFAEVFSKNLCNEISTCYTITIFLAGIIITIKLKLLDEKKSKVELILFIIGVFVNIVFLSVAYGYDCASIKFDTTSGEKIIDLKSIESALIILNATIWIDFIVLIRNLYLIIIVYFKKGISKKELAEKQKQEIENKDMSHNKIYILFIIVLLIILIALVICSFILGKNIYASNSKDNFFIEILAASIGGFCAIVGGFITLFGVKKTIQFEKEKDKKNNKEANKPHLYIPIKYKLNEVNEISVNNGIDNSPIWNKRIVLKNSSKCSFKIINIKINDKDYNSSLNLCIEDSFLFGLCFNYDELVNSITMKIEAFDGSRYNCIIALKEEKAVNLEVKDACYED